MCKAKPSLDNDSLLPLYYSYIHSYINYTNLAWASTHKTNLKKIHSQQKHALGKCIMQNNFLSTPFSASIGLKQGDILSTVF